MEYGFRKIDFGDWILDDFACMIWQDFRLVLNFEAEFWILTILDFGGLWIVEIGF